MGNRGPGLYKLINECNLIVVNKETIEEAFNRLLEYRHKPAEPTYYVSAELYYLIDAAIKNQYKEIK